MTVKDIFSKNIKNKGEIVMKKFFALILITMLIIGSATATSVAFASRHHGGHRPPPRHWHHHNHNQPDFGMVLGVIAAAVIIDAIVDNNNPCGEVVYQPPCNGPVPIASGNIPFGSGQYVQVASGQYADVTFRNGISQRFFGPRRIFDVQWYALYNQ